MTDTPRFLREHDAKTPKKSPGWYGEGVRRGRLEQAAEVERLRAVLRRIASGVHGEETTHLTAGRSAEKAWDAAREDARLALEPVP